MVGDQFYNFDFNSEKIALNRWTPGRAGRPAARAILWCFCRFCIFATRRFSGSRLNQKILDRTSQELSIDVKFDDISFFKKF